MRRTIVCLILFCTAFHALGQTEVFLGPGFGTNRNKKIVESDTRRYELTPFNQDFKIDLGVFTDQHFYLNAAFNIYRQDILTPAAVVTYPATGIPNTGYVYTSYTYQSRYKYQGFMVVPCFVTGNRVKFFAGAGFNLDYSRIDGTHVRVSQDHYHYDSTGNFVFDYNTVSDTTNQFIQRKGSDFSALAQTGVLIKLGSSLMLQLSAYFRRSLVLESLEAPQDYKSNAGLSVSLMYRLWSSNRPQPVPVE